jgi:hypothetical protein
VRLRAEAAGLVAHARLLLAYRAVSSDYLAVRRPGVPAVVVHTESYAVERHTARMVVQPSHVAARRTGDRD